MSTSVIPEFRSLSFWRTVDVPFQTCVAALDGMLRTGPGGGLRFGAGQLLGPMVHDDDLGTRRIQVRLSRSPLSPPRQMRLDVDLWSASSTALELVPSRLVRPTQEYFRAGHDLLDALAEALAGSLAGSLAGQLEPWAPTSMAS